MTISNSSDSAAAAMNRALETRDEQAESNTGRVPSDALADKDAFLQLLVAQIQNQDPLNPTDGMEFLSQLAQFSELEQMIGIRSELQALGTYLALSDANAANGE